LLVEKQKRISVRELLLCRSGRASDQSDKGLNDVQNSPLRGLMGFKTADRRERQREALIRAAESAIELGGLRNLKAREIADAAGCALGAIYNLVEDMDEIVLRVGMRTLARLDDALSKAAQRRRLNSTADAVERLIRIAIEYCRFAAANKNLWRTLFEHQMTNDKPVPTWFVDEQIRLFEHPSAPLRLLMSEAEERDVAMMSRTLFAAVHGIVLFGVEERMISVPRPLLEKSIADFVRLNCDGLLQRRHSSQRGE